MTKQRDDARRILHDVFGYPDFRGRQADIVDTLAGGGSLTVLMPPAAVNRSAIRFRL